MSSKPETPRSGPLPPPWAGAVGPWVAVAALAAWSAHPTAWFLAVAALGVVAAATGAAGVGRWRSVGLAVLVGGTVAGFAAHHRSAEVAGDWDGYWARQEARVGERIESALEERLLAAERAASAVAALAADSLPSDPGPLARVRSEARVAAVALYGPDGDLRTWDGVHRGHVPEEVQRGLRRYAYGDLPLFGYLYVTAPTASGGTAMAAVLLRADLPSRLAGGADDFASDFHRRWGEVIRLVSAPGDEGVPGWDWRLGERTLFTVVLQVPTPEARTTKGLGTWRSRIGAVALLAWLFLALGTPAGRGMVGAAASGALLMALLLPFQQIGALAPAFDPAAFAFPGTGSLSLGRLCALTLAAVATAAALPALPGVLGPRTVGLLGAALVPAALLWLASGVQDATLAEGSMGWLAFQAGAVLAVTLVSGILLGLARSAASRPGRMVAVAVAVGAAMGVAAAGWVWWRGHLPIWAPVLWAIPLALAATSSVRGRGGQAWGTWLLAGFLAATAGIPFAWGERVEARRGVAAEYLTRLALPDEPEVEDALRELAASATALAGRGERGVGLLYAAWRAGGLAELGTPAWLTIWSSAGIPGEELRIGVAQRPAVAYEILESPLPVGEPRIQLQNRDDARYVLRVTLPGGEILTVATPPFADPASLAVLSPLFAGGDLGRSHPVTIVPRAAWEGTRDGVRWTRARSGWRAEAPLSYANALYRAQYPVELPGPLLAGARAILLLTGNLLVLALAWGGGRALLGGGVPAPLQLSGVALSFRARVTLALFGFFVLAVALFGTVAYRTLAGTSGRAAQVLAGRVVEDAAGWYVEVGGRMQALSRRVGAELLEYRGGELGEGSVEELVALGLYEAWLPSRVHRRLARGEDVRDFDEAALGNWAYVSAFRRLPDGNVLVAHVPRSAGASAIRSSDVLEFLAVAVLLGALLSLGLAFLVGRTLTRPIRALQLASERVGAGDLGLTLPEERSDEFGAVFRAFNRMVSRVRRARRQLVRTTRRTKAIMEAAAVGMVALDADGRVTLANPRAAGLLGQRIEVGERLPPGGRLGRGLTDWLADFLEGIHAEADVELQDGERRIRVRARRLERLPARGGAVIALEDVTDELRTERVLAWGEMARQVAHEVKNPLTPMKLSVQHIRRAWDDRRPDFEAILVRNADAILGEIDRLAAIAKSFSRFGAPGDPGATPLEAVDVPAVVREVLALYRGSEGPVAFEDAVPSTLPPVRARVKEMKEVLVNLLENARIATPLGGTVRVEAAADIEGRGLRLQVVDTGSGIPEGLRARVFEPQFSTRSTGAGLGLAIVRRLVESWGGAVALESREGEGTRVTVSLEVWEEGDGDAGVASGGGFGHL